MQHILRAEMASWLRDHIKVGGRYLYDSWIGRHIDRRENVKGRKSEMPNNSGLIGSATRKGRVKNDIPALSENKQTEERSIMIRKVGQCSLKIEE